MVREQVRQYLGHCRALHQRLLKLKNDKIARFVHALEEVLNGKGYLFLFFKTRTVRPAGSTNTWNAKGHEVHIPGNSGRHFWQNILRQHGLGSRDIDRFMRHRVVGLENNTTSQLASPQASADRIVQVQLKVLARLGIEALSGLRKV